MHTKAVAEAEPEPEPSHNLAQGSGFIFLKPWAVKAEPKPRVLKLSRALTSLFATGQYKEDQLFVGHISSALWGHNIADATLPKKLILNLV